MRARAVFSVLVLAVFSVTLWRFLDTPPAIRAEPEVIEADSPRIVIEAVELTGGAVHFVAHVRGVPRAPNKWLCLAPVWEFGDETKPVELPRIVPCSEKPVRTMDARHTYMGHGFYSVRLRLFDRRARPVIEGLTTVLVLP